MTNDELSTSDVLADPTKNLCNIYQSNEDDDADDEGEKITLHDNQYYTETEFIDFIDNKKYTNGNYVTILSINIANLFSKLSSLKSFLTNITSKGNKPDVIVVVETHIVEDLNAGYDNKALTTIMPGYSFFHKGRKTKRGGGVGILVSNDINSEARICETIARKVKFIDEQFENIIVRIPGCIDGNRSNNKKDLVVVALYRQPNTENLEAFLRSTENLLNTIDKSKNEIIIAGDMNLDLLKFESHLPTSQYLDMMSNHQILPRIVRPTRIKNRSATLIDHIMTRNNGLTVDSGIIDVELAGNCGFTDHKLIFSIIRSKLPRKDRNKTFEVSYFTKEGHIKRREGLLFENWNQILSETDPNHIHSFLISRYDYHYKKNLTTKTVKQSSNRNRLEPWMTNEILADIRRRDRLAKIKGRRAEYKRIRNDIVAKTRQAEKTYLKQQVQESVGDMKKHWKILKKVLNKTNNKSDITTDFLYKGTWINDKQTNANNMNEYLENVGRETNESVGTSQYPPEHYLNKFKTRNEHSILLSDVSDEEVSDVCRSLTSKTSTDPFGFKQSIVLQDAGIIAHVIAHLVNCSIKEGICPDSSKVARVVPIYKLKGSKHLYENYRPISLLSTFSKIVERLIYNKLFDFLVRYEILFKSQFGFRKGHNTTHATLDFVKAIEDALENNEYAIGVFCDLSKAFDTINHDILLKKLDHYGIRGKANDWFRSYLSGREQYVDWNGKASKRTPIVTGVPQGSILGPLLFLIYINDLSAASQLKTVLFADDSNLLIRGKDLSVLKNVLNTELQIVNDYFKANKLKLNAKKTKLVCFRKKSRHIIYDDLQVFLDGVNLKFEEEAVFLGITIDSNLTWDKHCKLVADRISRNSSAINRVKKLLPPSSLKTLYSSLILSHLQYGLAAWGGCSSQNKKRIVSIQKRISRNVAKSFYSSHTEPRMKKLGILKLENLYEQQCMTLIHDTIYNRAPSPMKDLLSLGSDGTTHNLRSHQSDPLNLRLPVARSKVGSNSFCIKGADIWNKLPNELKTIESRSSFKNRIKQHLLNSYSTKTECNNPRCSDRSHHIH